MEQTMNAVDETMNSADDAVYHARKQIQDVSGIVDERIRSHHERRTLMGSSEPICLIMNRRRTDLSRRNYFEPEYHEDVSRSRECRSAVEDETVAETIMEVAAEGMQEFEVPKFEAPPKYQEPRFDPPQNISQENFAESLNDFVPSLEENLVFPEKK